MAKQWWLDKDEHADHTNDPQWHSAHHSHQDEPDETHEVHEVTRKRPKLRTWQVVALSIVVLFLGGMTYVWIQVSKGLPTLDQLENPHPELATRLISADGEPLDQYFIKNRTTVHLKNVPPFLLQALIATEDRDFYNHWGINLWGNIRAAWTDLVTLSPRQGASTITQQLARNLYLTQEKSILRKLREMGSAVQIERTHTKSEILDMYLNVAYFGRGAYGIEAASQVYFGKDVNQLSPAESAYLVGVLKGPENYDPDEYYERAIARRNTVLDNMVDAKFVSAAEIAPIRAQPIRTQAMRGYQGIAPHFVEMIRQDLSKKPELQGYDLYRDGLVVYTTLNATMQRAANKAVMQHITDYQKNVVDKRWNWAAHKGLLDTLVSKAIRSNSEYRIAQSPSDRSRIEKQLRTNAGFIDSVKAAEIRMQCGFVCLDQSTGQILAMVGSSNFAQARYGLNHVTQIVRQPGSAFKPIIYAACFENGSTPETSVSNEPISIPDGDHVWSPGNFEGEAAGGYRTIRTALQYSVNLCAIHAMLELTSTHDVIVMAKRLGIRSNIPAYPSIALGTAEVNPLELTSAYSTFANEGVRATPYAIVRVEDRNGKIIYRSKPEFQNVLEPRIAHMMTSALSDVVNSGTAARIRSLGFHYPAAGKTGTTQNYADAWFIGYTPHFTAGTWVGFDDKRVSFTGADGQGGRAAAPIWGLFMKYTYEALRPKIEYFVTSYSNTPGAGEAPIHSDLGDTSGPEIHLTPLPNAPSRNPKPSTPLPVQPLPNVDTKSTPVGDNSSEDVPSIGQSQATPGYKSDGTAATYGPPLPTTTPRTPQNRNSGVTIDNRVSPPTTVDNSGKPPAPPKKTGPLPPSPDTKAPDNVQDNKQP